MWSTIALATGRHSGSLFARTAAPLAQRALVLPVRTFRRGIARAAGRVVRKAPVAAGSRPGKAAAAKKPKATKAARPKKRAVKAVSATKKKRVIKAKARKEPRLTPEQIKRQKLKAIRIEALIPQQPKRLPQSGYTVFTAQAKLDVGEGATTVLERAGKWSKAWSAVSKSERDHLDTIARQNVLSNQAAYKQWVESFEPAQIYNANKARKKYNKATGRQIPLIKDSRIPKRPLSPFMLFVMAEASIPKIEELGISNRGRVAGQKWRELSADEQEAYRSIAFQNAVTHAREREQLGIPSTFFKRHPEVQPKA